MELSQSALQSQRQAQAQRMSRLQIQAMRILSLGAGDLERAVYEFAEKNPALELREKPTPAHLPPPRRGNADFDALIDRTADTRTSLREHLESQLNSMRLPPDVRELGARLIGNLDADGHHILSPLSFLDAKNPAHTTQLLEKTVSIIQTLDPVGTCVKDVAESLLVQARNADEPNALALFILDGHFDFLDPPRTDKILKRLKDFSAAERKLRSYGAEAAPPFDGATLSPSDVQNALDFIKTLDPKPARAFGGGEPGYIRADAVVKLLGGSVAVSFPRDELPEMRISGEYERVATGAESEREKANAQFARRSILEARAFIEAVGYRKSALRLAALEIASVQFDFFTKGPAFLKPFLQKDLAKRLRVHETTISRIANGKYLSCDFGVFPFGYFFSGGVGGGARKTPEAGGETQSRADSGAAAEGGSGAASKEAAKFLIAEILSAHKDSEKPLSDQKISRLLAERGVAVARRTVAKYRAELNVGSSYER